MIRRETHLYGERGPANPIMVEEASHDVFVKRCPADCLDCGYCEDECCSYGCDVDVAEKSRIMGYSAQLQAWIGVPASEWFEDELVADAEYPSGAIVRTRVRSGKCVFHSRRRRGCALHSFAVQAGMDWLLFKPMVCALFPITWRKGRLLVSEFFAQLPCWDKGLPMFEAQKRALEFYLGRGFVSALAERPPITGPCPTPIPAFASRAGRAAPLRHLEETADISHTEGVSRKRLK
jgi:Fe-S-cluster containining protein